MQSSAAEDRSSEHIPATRRFFRRIKSVFFHSKALYRLNLMWKFGRALPLTGRAGALPNEVLQTRDQLRAASEMGRRLHWPLHRADGKNWDHLAAVVAILNNTAKSARIFDAGAEFYSNVLPALFACGYRELYGMNLSFVDRARRGSIRYLPGDITHTAFSDAFFDAVTCMSVIEHGVPLDAYFREMHRVLKPGGLLITSTDYFAEPIDTRGQTAHGAPIKIFSRSEAEAMLALARACGFEQTGPIDLESHGRPIRWEEYDLDYSFLIFTLRKPA